MISNGVLHLNGVETGSVQGVFSQLRRRVQQWRTPNRQKQKLREPIGLSAELDGEIVNTITKVRAYTLSSVERLSALCEAVRYLTRSGIPGDIVECGVGRGGRMMAVAETLRKAGDVQRNLHLFDAFHADDRSGVTEKVVRDHLALTRYPERHTFYYRGMFEDTILGGRPDQIALLQIENGPYEATRLKLEHLFPRLTNGGILILDEAGPTDGARKAIDEYLEKFGIGMMLHRLDCADRIWAPHTSISRLELTWRRDSQGSRDSTCSDSPAGSRDVA